MQTFTAPISTSYKIECWGAQGGNINFKDVVGGGAKGGYTSGILNLLKQSTLYIYVGQHPETIDVLQSQSDIAISYPKGYNGGGRGSFHRQLGNSGGGATDIRIISGNWNDFNSLKSRIMVAAGGGGGGSVLAPTSVGCGGGLIGCDGLVNSEEYYIYSGTGGTQTYAGTCPNNYPVNGDPISKLYQGGFGFGGDTSPDFEYGGCGGGGGYYGGGASARGHEFGGGGSSFISGYSGCDAIAESSTEDNIIHTGQPNHYSGKVFSNSVMIAGNASMPKPKGGIEQGHSGDGYCIISWISPSL